MPVAVSATVAAASVDKPAVSIAEAISLAVAPPSAMLVAVAATSVAVAPPANASPISGPTTEPITANVNNLPKSLLIKLPKLISLSLRCCAAAAALSAASI